jgi:acyl-coenzyme A thioesterase PaaI-like protein
MTAPEPARDLETLLRSLVEERTPHNRTLGIRLLGTGPADATCTIPYNLALAKRGQSGAIDEGAIDEGAIAALMDVTCGGSVCMHLGRIQPIATLELRLDFVRPSRPGRPLTAHGYCHQLMRSIAFVRAWAHDGAPEDMVAIAQGTFILMGE